MNSFYRKSIFVWDHVIPNRLSSREPVSLPNCPDLRCFQFAPSESAPCAERLSASESGSVWVLRLCVCVCGWDVTRRVSTNRVSLTSCSLDREEMKSLQAALQKQLDEANEKAEKQQATVRRRCRHLTGDVLRLPPV